MEGTRLKIYIFGKAAIRPARADCRMEVSHLPHFVWSASLPKVRSRYWNLKLPYLDCTTCIVVTYVVKVTSSAKSGDEFYNLRKWPKRQKFGEVLRDREPSCLHLKTSSFVLHFCRRYVHGIGTCKCHTLTVPRCS